MPLKAVANPLHIYKKVTVHIYYLTRRQLPQNMFPNSPGVEVDGADGGEGVELKCRVMLQKELPDGLRDEECGVKATVGHAGLCMYV